MFLQVHYNDNKYKKQTSFKADLVKISSFTSCSYFYEVIIH